MDSRYFSRSAAALLLFFSMLSASLALFAAPAAVPAPLEPWRDWVLDGHRDMACPPHYAALGERQCHWPGRLQLDANGSGAAFAQQWQLYAPGWVNLPGDSRYWPQAVRANERTVPVIERGGRPAVWLATGEYRVTGSIVWDALPHRLALPADSGLLTVTLNGKVLLTPSIDEQGQVLFGENREQKVVADSLSVQVFRRVQDDIPLQLESVARFKVAGRDRELLTGRLLLAGMLPLQLDSPLPARIEDDGRLRVQLRAGEWEIRLLARADGQPMQFALERTDESWPAEEIWSVQDNRSLRQISVTGPASIDPSQTELPGHWRDLPAWLLTPDGAPLVLSEQQRGMPPGDGTATLGLQRELWLDFDGKGMTSRDVLTGTLQQPLRLATADGQQLGRVEVNGEPQLITRLEGESAQGGVELRPGALRLLGISRIGNPRDLSITGWQSDMESAQVRLHLPPGWTLLHAVGADHAEGAWLPRWNLWGIFLVLIIAAASFRLLGAWAGGVAGLALLLTYHSAHAPVFLWLAALVVVGLLRVLPAGRLRHAVAVCAGGVFILLALVLLQFTVDQARRSLYPQLERGAYATIQPAREAAEAAAPASVSADGMADVAVDRSYEVMASRVPMARQLSKALRTGYDTGAKVQTGPGEPAWQWNSVTLRWSGPVLQSQSLRLYLMSPTWQRVWNLSSVLLVFALAGLLWRAAWPVLQGLRASRAAPALLACLLALGQVGETHAEQAHPDEKQTEETAAAPFDWPSPSLLQQLEARLTRLPDCEPVCASLNRGLLTVQDGQWRLDLQIDAQEQVAVPLPVARHGWQPRTVTIDGETAAALRRDEVGQLWAVIDPGSRRVLLEGVTQGDSAEWPFPMPVHNLGVDAAGWQVSGLVNGQVPGHSLQLARESQPTGGMTPETSLLPDVAPPFVRVTRTLVLGLDWQVQTRVERIAPQAGAINLAITLLPGEAVLTPGLVPRDGKLPVSLSTYSQEISWYSSLPQNAELVLQAAERAPWVEHWQLDAAPIWHVETQGLNPVQQAMEAGGLPRWQPWPGERLQLDITRPQAVEGATRTVEAAVLAYSPGARSADATLQLTVRASQGGELPLGLPPGSQLLRVVLDGREQSLPQGDVLRLPLHPGQQRLDVSWREMKPLGVHLLTPQPLLDEPLTNIRLHLTLPQGRWLLAVGGPSMGPALLFWGVLAVMLAVAVLLGRAGFAPVSTWQWLLLCLGMSTVNSVGSLVVVAWFAATAWRERLSPAAFTRGRFNLLQAGLVLLTLAAAGCLIGTIPMSLLSSPDMQVVGNQSSALELMWYQDRTTQGFPEAWVVSLPLGVYRAVMLVWSLWLVFALLGWSRWGWLAFSAGGYWRGAGEPAAGSTLTLDEAALKE